MFARGLPRVVGVVHQPLDALEISPACTLRRVIARKKCVHWPHSSELDQRRASADDSDAYSTKDDHSKSEKHFQNDDTTSDTPSPLTHAGDAMEFWNQLEDLIALSDRSDAHALTRSDLDMGDMERQNSDTPLPSTSSDSRELLSRKCSQCEPQARELCQRRHSSERVVQVVRPWLRVNKCDVTAQQLDDVSAKINDVTSKQNDLEITHNWI